MPWSASPPPPLTPVNRLHGGLSGLGTLGFKLGFERGFREPLGLMRSLLFVSSSSIWHDRPFVARPPRCPTGSMTDPTWPNDFDLTISPLGSFSEHRPFVCHGLGTSGIFEPFVPICPSLWIDLLTTCGFHAPPTACFAPRISHFTTMLYRSPGSAFWPFGMDSLSTISRYRIRLHTSQIRGG